MPTIIETEPDLDEQRHNAMPHVNGTRTSCDATGHEVIEILSDSEDEQPIPKTENASIDSNQILTTSAGMIHEKLKTEILQKDPEKQSSLPFDPTMFMKEASTIWTDSEVTSFAVEGKFQVTKEVRVNRVEYLATIPCVWPIAKIQTAFILDLRDDAKYLVCKKAGGNSATPVTPDFLLKNMVSKFKLQSDITVLLVLITIQDQNSWKGGTGIGDSTTHVMFQRGFPPITCRRSCLACKGVYACSGIDQALLDVERHDLDPASRLKIFEAQASTRVDGRSSVEQCAATYAQSKFINLLSSSQPFFPIFLNVCHSRCPAVDNNGQP